MPTRSSGSSTFCVRLPSTRCLVVGTRARRGGAGQSAAWTTARASRTGGPARGRVAWRARPGGHGATGWSRRRAAAGRSRPGTHLPRNRRASVVHRRARTHGAQAARPATPQQLPAGAVGSCGTAGAAVRASPRRRRSRGRRRAGLPLRHPRPRQRPGGRRRWSARSTNSGGARSFASRRTSGGISVTTAFARWPTVASDPLAAGSFIGASPRGWNCCSPIGSTSERIDRHASRSRRSTGSRRAVPARAAAVATRVSAQRGSDPLSHARAVSARPASGRA